MKYKFKFDDCVKINRPDTTYDGAIGRVLVGSQWKEKTYYTVVLTTSSKYHREESFYEDELEKVND